MGCSGLVACCSSFEELGFVLGWLFGEFDVVVR